MTAILVMRILQKIEKMQQRSKAAPSSRLNWFLFGISTSGWPLDKLLLQRVNLLAAIRFKASCICSKRMKSCRVLTAEVLNYTKVMQHVKLNLLISSTVKLCILKYLTLFKITYFHCKHIFHCFDIFLNCVDLPFINLGKKF